MSDRLLMLVFICFLILVVIINCGIRLFNKKSISTVEFYPPKAMNPAHLGYFLDGKVDAHDLVGLIIYMESKGYVERLKIKKEDQNITLLKKKKPLNNDEDSYLHHLYNHMFNGKKDTIILNGSEAFDFSNELNNINKSLDDMYHENPIFNSKQRKIKGILVIMLCIILTLPVVYGAIDIFLIDCNDDELSSLLSAFGYILGFIIVNKAYLNIIYKNGDILFKKQANFSMRLLMILIVIVTLAFNSGFYFISTIGYCNNYLINFLIPLTAVVSLLVISNIKWRNNDYKELLGKVIGYKKFIQLTEKDKIDKLIIEDPDYFYKTIPYAYIFGVSDKWIKKEHNDIGDDLLDSAVFDELESVIDVIDEAATAIVYCVLARDIIIEFINYIKKSWKKE